MNFDTEVVTRSLPYLFGQGLIFTLQLTMIATIGGIVLGTVIALLRLSGIKALENTAAIYVNAIRALPLVLVIFLFYFLSPHMLQWMTGASRPVTVGAYASAMVTFTLFEAAYFSEIVRAGIQSLPRGQLMAGAALGMRPAQVMVNVVLPQAFRNMLPIIFTQTIILFQDTSLVYVLSITDFMGASAKIAQREGRLVEMYVFAALVYFAISFSASLMVGRLQQRMTAPRH